MPEQDRARWLARWLRGCFPSGSNDSICHAQDIAPLQSSYRRKALQLVERLSLAPPAVGSTEELACERLAERLLASDPAAEEAHRALIRLYRHRGKTNAALR